MCTDLRLYSDKFSFTNCRSNSFELVTVRAGDSTISYRTVLGSQILVVVVLSSCSVGSGALLDDVLVHLHDSGPLLFVCKLARLHAPLYLVASP